MRKDIEIPKVENVFLAAIPEWNDDFMNTVWNVYLVNDSDFTLESVMVVSCAKGVIAGEAKKSSTLRHGFAAIPAVSAVKIEMIEESVLQLNNEFMLSYFIGPKLYDKKFTFEADSISNHNTEEIPVIFKDGVIVR